MSKHKYFSKADKIRMETYQKAIDLCIDMDYSKAPWDERKRAEYYKRTVIGTSSPKDIQEAYEEYGIKELEDKYLNKEEHEWRLESL